MSLVDDLRQLADVIEANPELGLNFVGISRESIYVEHGRPFVERVRQLAKFGVVEKERSTSFLARVALNKTFELVAIDYTNEVACELVQTGVETVVEPIMEQVGERTVERPIMEWKCPESILAGAS